MKNIQTIRIGVKVLAAANPAALAAIVDMHQPFRSPLPALVRYFSRLPGFGRMQAGDARVILAPSLPGWKGRFRWLSASASLTFSPAT